MRAVVLALTLSLGGSCYAGAATQRPWPVDRKVALDVRQVPLRAALDRLFRGSELTYAVTPGVPDVLITLKFRDTRLEDGVRALIETASTQVPGISAARDGSVYLVRIAELAEPQVAAPPPEAEQPATQPEETTAAAEEPVWEKIPLNFLDAGSAAVALGGAIFPGPPKPLEERASLDPFLLAPPGLVILGRREDNSLIIRGNPADIAEVRRLLALFDTP